ncbi:MAG: hypothetical protein NC218_06060 [Acetobacter sp.]|nr:hypothetical protein [Acetobacter sp.]
MKKKILIITLLSLFISSKNAYAVLDIPDFLQDLLVVKTDVENKLKEVAKLKQDTETMLREGYAVGSKCFTNPLNCYSDAVGFVEKTNGYIDGIRTTSKDLKNTDLMKKAPNEIAAVIREEGTYQKGLGEDIKRREQLEAENNAAVTDLLAILFAKGMVTRHNILQEDTELYNRNFKDDNREEILFAHNTLLLQSNKRIARILELRSLMFNAQAFKELTQYNREIDE